MSAKVGLYHRRSERTSWIKVVLFSEGFRPVINIQRLCPTSLVRQWVEFLYRADGPETHSGTIKSASRAWASSTARMRIGRPLNS
jgi:hypothetical protein